MTNDDTTLQEGLTAILTSLAASSDAEAQALLQTAFEKISNYSMDTTNPENFHLFLVNKLENALEQLAKTHCNILPAMQNIHKPTFIYLHYDFLDQNLERFCEFREGGSCCADKSRNILRMYLTYACTGEIPAFDPSMEPHFFPHFGTHEDWMNLCDGLYSFYYGNPERYLKAYNTLIQSEIRKYKHILHTWYIKFKDGEVIKIDYDWDDRTQNPLANDYFDKGEYYLIDGKYVKHRNYEMHESEDRFLCSYCKVPKSDIAEFYKTSEEKMV
jgi:hypothetical protein